MESLERTFSLSEMSETPDFIPTIAHRIWQTWWRDVGVLQDEIEVKVHAALCPEAVPTAFVAHRDGTYLGSALLIESDFAARPQLTPWVAAVWTEEVHRREGIGTALVARMAQLAFENGYSRVYLCASDDNTPFYEKMGWRVLEYHVKQLNVLALDKPASS
ncbi:GNAT family N-acetyltransferase [Pseudovibrio sp. WM33]|uniref:GNAT family N-acetyltransferase n=1 Tax=Pseudovibrio sp. WM33 TaxID=1735585 RepID=UPI0007AE7DE0|nr:GNAT family N-acetyltransferase [Pseudovibrio sp. WM33]KZL25899.1 Acetyltransferase (GNAT) family protein [Pseudovibrio sp. WM33]